MLTVGQQLLSQQGWYCVCPVVPCNSMHCLVSQVYNTHKFQLYNCLTIASCGYRAVLHSPVEVIKLSFVHHSGCKAGQHSPVTVQHSPVEDSCLTPVMDIQVPNTHRLSSACGHLPFVLHVTLVAQNHLLHIFICMLQHRQTQTYTHVYENTCTYIYKHIHMSLSLFFSLSHTHTHTQTERIMDKGQDNLSGTLSYQIILNNDAWKCGRYTT